MTPNHVGQGLHDRATRGEVLSDEDMARLSNWYDQMDHEEAQSLSPGAQNPLLDVIQEKVLMAKAELSALREEAQRLSSENEALRGRTEELERQLSRKRATRAR